MIKKQKKVIKNNKLPIQAKHTADEHFTNHRSSEI